MTPDAHGRITECMDYPAALSTLAYSSPLPADAALTWLRRISCREAGGAVGRDRGYWTLTAHERAVLTALVLRANEYGVVIATADELAAAGCPRNSQAAAIRRLTDGGYLTVLGARGRRLFVIPTEPPAAWSRPAEWTPAQLHRSLRERPADSAPPKAVRTPTAPRLTREQLLARVQASPLGPEIIATLQLAAEGQGVDRLDLADAATIVEAVEHAIGPAPTGETWVRVRRAIASTNGRTDEQGRPFSASPRRWAGYLAAVADAERMSGAERAAAALARLDAEAEWEERVADAAEGEPEPEPHPPVSCTPTPAEPPALVRARPAGPRPEAPVVWDAESVAELARQALGK